MRTLAARHVFVGTGWLSPGLLAWDEDGVLIGVARAPRGTRLTDVAVLPGLVNAHAHLQLKAVGDAPPNFVQWIGKVMAARGRTSLPELATTVRAHLAALLRGGCTAVGEIDNAGTSPRVLARANFAGRCYQEVTGFHLGRDDARSLLRTREQVGSDACPGGIAPHAPYSVSAPLFAACRSRRVPMAVHVAELPEEQQFLHTGKGSLRDLLAKLDRLPRDFTAPGLGAVRYLERLGCLLPRTLLVHCQELERGDAARISAAGAPIVVCPGTIRYFGRVPPPVEDWLRRGIPVALGTDSRASNRALSMQDELAEATRLWPTLDPMRLLAMATENGARALSHRSIGRIRRGARADFFAIPCTENPVAAVASFVHGALSPVAVWLAGGKHAGRLLAQQG